MVFVLVSGGVTTVGVYYPFGSAAGCVAVEFEQVVQPSLGGVEVGDHASGAGSSAVGLVEQHGFLDAAQVAQQPADGQVESGVVGVAAHEVGDLQRQRAVEGVHADLVLGPVVHRRERHHVRVFELPEAVFAVGLGAVPGD
jgi:hypothetical protein